MYSKEVLTWAEIGKMSQGSLAKEWEEESTRQRTLDAKPLKWERAQSIESRPVSPNDWWSEQERDTRLIALSNILGNYCSRYWGYDNERQNPCLHGSYLLVGKRDYKCVTQYKFNFL